VEDDSGHANPTSAISVGKGARVDRINVDGDVAGHDIVKHMPY
jgi:hypothetical protein